MEIRTGRLTLRPFRAGDEAGLVREANDRRVWRLLRDRFPHPYTEVDARKWIAAESGREPAEALAVTRRDGGALLGGVGIERRTDIVRFTAELGYWLGASHWGRGLATEAVAAFVDYVFAAFELERLEAWVFDSNRASARVLEKCGFLHEGTARRGVHKAGRFDDSRLYARLRDDPAPAAR